METLYCSNCGLPLSEVSVQLAIKDIDGDVPLDRVTFFCPGYDGVEGICAVSGEEEMAYWYTL